MNALEEYENSTPHDGISELFTALADVFIRHALEQQAQGTPPPSSAQIDSLCVAGGVCPYSRRHMTNAKNYIRAALGFEALLLEAPIHSPRQTIVKAAPVMEYKPIPSTAGMVYILRNASIPGLLKIGFTSALESVAVRVSQLSQSTSVPTPFEVVASFQSGTARLHEQKIHRLLAGVKSKKREFFAVSEVEAIAACESIIGASA